MLLFLGREGSRTAVLAKLLEHLKTSVQVLNESTFETLVPTMDKTTPIIVEQGATVGKHQEVLLKTIKEKDMVIVMADCDEGDLSDYDVAVSPSGKYVAVKNNSNGRDQEVLVINEEKPPREFRAEHEEITDALEPGENEEEEPTGDPDASVMSAATDIETEEIASLAKFLEEERILKGDTQAHYWEHKTRLTYVIYNDFSPDDTHAPGWLNVRLRKGHIKAFCSIDIFLFATKSPRQKWIEFRLTDAVGMNSKMGSDDRWAKGYFNHSSTVYLFPGNGSNPHHSSLPTGWTRPNIEPHTPNEQTTYTSTTGWSFGVGAGVDPGGPNANVTASYSTSNQKTTTMKDFSVRNVSDHSMSGWNFYYTAVDGRKWAGHFYRVKNEPKGIANLAKSTLQMNSEAVYEGPPDTKAKLFWSFKVEYMYACLRGNWANKWMYQRRLPFSVKHVVINMGLIRNPNPGRERV